MPEETYTNIYGKTVTRQTIDRGNATEEEKEQLEQLDRDILRLATWAEKVESKVVVKADKRQYEVSIWGQDDDPYRIFYFDAIPDTSTVLKSMSVYFNHR